MLFFRYEKVIKFGTKKILVNLDSVAYMEVAPNYGEDTPSDNTKIHFVGGENVVVEDSIVEHAENIDHKLNKHYPKKGEE